MFYAQELDKVTSRLNDRPALKHVYQAETGEFIASDGLIMLIDDSTALDYFNSWWKFQTPVMSPASPEPLNKWRFVLSSMADNARRRWQLDRVTYTAGLANINNLFINERYFKTALNFVGVDAVLLIPSERNSAVLLHNSDKTRTALIMPYNLKSDDLRRAKWDVLDDSSNIIFTTNNLTEAESFGFTVRLHK